MPACHGIAVACPAKHLDVVGHISEGNNICCVYPQGSCVFGQSHGLVDAGKGYFQHGHSGGRVGHRRQVSHRRRYLGQELIGCSFTNDGEELHHGVIG
jgi:hypothetical protein